MGSLPFYPKSAILLLLISLISLSLIAIKEIRERKRDQFLNEKLLRKLKPKKNI
jgi:hypothetical protein